KVRVRYTPVYFMTVPSNKGPTQLMVIYGGSLYGKNKWRIQGNQIIMEGYDMYGADVILPTDWTKVKLSIKGYVGYLSCSVGFKMNSLTEGYSLTYLATYLYSINDARIEVRAEIEIRRTPLNMKLQVLWAEDLEKLDWNTYVGTLRSYEEPEPWELLLGRVLGIGAKVPPGMLIVQLKELVRK
ncbi:MAG: hypothetical protein DRJ96_07640, partial [Thermoprotei archaeon]